VLFTLSPVTSTHATHTTTLCVPFTYTRHYNRVAVNNMADMCALCSSLILNFFWWQILLDFFPTKNLLGKILDIYNLIIFFIFFWKIFQFVYITKLRWGKGENFRTWEGIWFKLWVSSSAKTK
jgi:hypothetical protein